MAISYRLDGPVFEYRMEQNILWKNSGHSPGPNLPPIHSVPGFLIGG